MFLIQLHSTLYVVTMTHLNVLLQRQVIRGTTYPPTYTYARSSSLVRCAASARREAEGCSGRR